MRWVDDPHRSWSTMRDGEGHVLGEACLNGLWYLNVAKDGTRGRADPATLAGAKAAVEAAYWAWAAERLPAV